MTTSTKSSAASAITTWPATASMRTTIPTRTISSSPAAKPSTTTSGRRYLTTYLRRRSHHRRSGQLPGRHTWYDVSGNPIKQQPEGTQLFAKTVYDGLGRTVKQYQGIDPDETAYADAGTVDDDTILEQPRSPTTRPATRFSRQPAAVSTTPPAKAPSPAAKAFLPSPVRRERGRG